MPERIKLLMFSVNNALVHSIKSLLLILNTSRDVLHCTVCPSCPFVPFALQAITLHHVISLSSYFIRLLGLKC